MSRLSIILFVAALVVAVQCATTSPSVSGTVSISTSWTTSITTSNTVSITTSNTVSITTSNTVSITTSWSTSISTSNSVSNSYSNSVSISLSNSPTPSPSSTGSGTATESKTVSPSATAPLLSRCGDGINQGDRGDPAVNEECDLGTTSNAVYGQAGACCSTNCHFRPGGIKCAPKPVSDCKTIPRCDGKGTCREPENASNGSPCKLSGAKAVCRDGVCTKLSTIAKKKSTKKTQKRRTTRKSRR